MSNQELERKAARLRMLRREREELEAEAEAIQAEIRRHMEGRGADTLLGADWKITLKPVNSSRFDVAAFREAMPGLAERFMKQTTATRFILT